MLEKVTERGLGGVCVFSHVVGSIISVLKLVFTKDDALRNNPNIFGSGGVLKTSSLCVCFLPLVLKKVTERELGGVCVFSHVVGSIISVEKHVFTKEGLFDHNTIFLIVKKSSKHRRFACVSFP